MSRLNSLNKPFTSSIAGVSSVIRFVISADKTDVATPVLETRLILFFLLADGTAWYSAKAASAAIGIRSLFS